MSDSSSQADQKNRIMPDVANSSKAAIRGTLHRVGMSEIEMPVRLQVPGLGQMAIPARIDAYVNLTDPDSKGIHMSRLYLRLHENLPNNELSLPVLRDVLSYFLGSHSDRSDTAELRIRCELMLCRPSLISDNEGYRSYPLEIHAVLTGAGLRVRLSSRVAYSSTCPCSAALARQLIQEKFLQDYDGVDQVSVDEMAEWIRKPESICATPHSQRSYATVTVEYGDQVEDLNPLRYIDAAEGALKTVVQAAVKREDEQEFARVNGANLMFCEDAGRRLKAAIEELEEVRDYHIEARHVESLHPHDAVSIVVKGVPGGFEP